MLNGTQQKEWESKETITNQLSDLRTNTEHQIKEVKKFIQDLKQSFNKELEAIKADQLEGKEIKNKVESLESRLDHAEDRISGIEDSLDIIEKEHTTIQDKSKKYDRSIQHLEDTIRRPNLRIMGVEEHLETEVNGLGNLFNRILAENFPNIQKDRPIQIQEAFRTPNRPDQNRTSHRHIIIHTGSTQTKEKILKAVKEKRVITYKGKPIRITSDFSAETIKARRAWNEVCHALKTNNYQPRILYPAKLSFITEGQIKTFHSKEKLKQYISTKPALQKILKDVLHIENQQDRNKGQETAPKLRIQEP